MRKKVVFVLTNKYIDTRPGEFPTVHNQAWQDLARFHFAQTHRKLTPDQGMSINTIDFVI